MKSHNTSTLKEDLKSILEERQEFKKIFDEKEINDQVIQDAIRFSHLRTTLGELDQEYQFQSKIGEAFEYKSRQNIKSVLDQFEEDIQKSQDNKVVPQAKVIPFYKKNVFRIAASIALIFMLGIGIWPYLNPENADQYQEFYSIPSHNYSMRSDDTHVNTDLHTAFQLFDEGEYNKAIEQFDQLIPTQSNPDLKLFKAISQLELQQFNQAKATLENLLNIAPDNIEATWYLALVHYQLDEIEESKALLTEIEKSQHFRAQLARDFLDRIK